MEYLVHTVQGRTLIEGAPGQPLMKRAGAIVSALEACLSNAANRLLLYPENLPERFFDLSSGEAGEILQKLRNYRIRLAIVRTPSLQMSSRFGELLADEQRGSAFRMFDTREAAQEWLSQA